MAIRNCVCVDEFQDNRYGKGRRVHNAFTNGRDKGIRCTICLDQKAVAYREPKAKGVTVVRKIKTAKKSKKQ